MGEGIDWLVGTRELSGGTSALLWSYDDGCLPQFMARASMFRMANMKS